MEGSDVLSRAARGDFDESMLRAMRAAPDAVLTATLENVHEPADLRAVADAFDHVHLPAFASAVRRRATLREMPEAERTVLRCDFQKAILSGDPALMRSVGARLQECGAVHSARVLFDRAWGLPEKEEADA